MYPCLVVVYNKTKLDNTLQAMIEKEVMDVALMEQTWNAACTKSGNPHDFFCFCCWVLGISCWEICSSSIMVGATSWFASASPKDLKSSSGFTSLESPCFSSTTTSSLSFIGIFSRGSFLLFFLWLYQAFHWDSISEKIKSPRDHQSHELCCKRRNDAQLYGIPVANPVVFSRSWITSKSSVATWLWNSSTRFPPVWSPATGHCSLHFDFKNIFNPYCLLQQVLNQSYLQLHWQALPCLLHWPLPWVLCLGSFQPTNPFCCF